MCSWTDFVGGLGGGGGGGGSNPPGSGFFKFL